MLANDLSMSQTDIMAYLASGKKFAKFCLSKSSRSQTNINQQTWKHGLTWVVTVALKFRIHRMPPGNRASVYKKKEQAI